MDDGEEVFDPYDMSSYTNPKSQQNQDLNNDPEKNLSQKVFNPYNSNQNENENEEENLQNMTDEKSELKPKKKSKRKKTDENLSENIDLTKSAYDENSKGENNSEEKVNNKEEEDEIEPPLLEELGINPQNIKNKIIGVITLKRIDKKFLEDSDMADCYSLGYNAFMLIQYGYTGYLSKVSNISTPAEEWVAAACPSPR